MDTEWGNTDDWKRMLDVEDFTDVEAVKQGYRRQLKKHHPDRNPRQGAALFHQVQDCHQQWLRWVEQGMPALTSRQADPASKPVVCEVCQHEQVDLRHVRCVGLWPTHGRDFSGVMCRTCLEACWCEGQTTGVQSWPVWALELLWNPPRQVWTRRLLLILSRHTRLEVPASTNHVFLSRQAEVLEHADLLVEARCCHERAGRFSAHRVSNAAPTGVGRAVQWTAALVTLFVVVRLVTPHGPAMGEGPVDFGSVEVFQGSVQRPQPDCAALRKQLAVRQEQLEAQEQDMQRLLEKANTLQNQAARLAFSSNEELANQAFQQYRLAAVAFRQASQSLIEAQDQHQGFQLQVELACPVKGTS